MPGRPVLRRLAAAIAAKGDPGSDPHGEQYIWDRIVSGETLKAIASDFGVSAGTLLSWLKLGGRDGPRWRAYQEARELSAFVKEEEAQRILQELAEEASVTPQSVTAPRVTLASAIAAHKRWQAERRNRTDFGQQAAPQVAISIQELHLDALKAAGGPRRLGAVSGSGPGADRAQSEPEGVQEADYELLPAGAGIGELL